MKITTVGIDLAKNVFQVHGIDERGKAAIQTTRSWIGRGRKCLSRPIGALHDVMPSPARTLLPRQPCDCAPSVSLDRGIDRLP